MLWMYQVYPDLVQISAIIGLKLGFPNVDSWILLHILAFWNLPAIWRELWSLLSSPLSTWRGVPSWLCMCMYLATAFKTFDSTKQGQSKIIDEFITTIGQIIIPIRSFLSLNRNCDYSTLNLLAFSWILSVISPCSPKIDLVFFNMHPPSQPSIPYIGARKGTLIWIITNWSTVYGLWSTLSQT